MDSIREKDYGQSQAKGNQYKEKGRCQMGDKGSKKDKAKDQKQNAFKKQQEEKAKAAKQPKRKP